MKKGLRPGVLILAGGRGSRCGGRDKGWMKVGGEAFVARRLRELAEGNWPIAISANRTLDRYRALGVPVFVDATPDFAGPLAAVSAALHAQFADPLLTVPVDALRVPAATFHRLLSESEDGQRPAYACDADGVQPLVAVWPASVLLVVDEALRSSGRSVRALQQRLAAVGVKFPLERFGNVNTHSDFHCEPVSVTAVGPC